MNPEMMEALQAMAAERGISTDVLLQLFANSLESAYKRMPGAAEQASSRTQHRRSGAHRPRTVTAGRAGG